MRPSAEDLRDVEATNAAFAAEVERFRLKFQCRDCAHVDPTDGTCSLGFPNAVLQGPPRVIAPGGELTFCKSFELN